MATLVATGCGSSTHPSDKPGTPPASSVSSDPNAAAKAQVLTAYQGMVNAQVKGYAQGTFDGTDIEKYAFDKALAGAKDTLFVDLRNNIVMKGAPSFQVTRTTVDLNSSPHRADLTVCWDDATWTPVDKKTGKSVAVPGQPKRYVVVSQLRTVGDRWVVIDGSGDRERKC